jgi:alkylation response protein AidB-like acyl-CoA dehydrogenase
MAVTDKSQRSKGISAFIFEKGMNGFSPSKKENKLGLRASETASVVFEDCFVPESQLLGEEGHGFVNAMEILDGGRISIAALAVGIAQGAYESAVRYAKERQQFGKPIAEFQAIQFKLADMATQIDAARLMTLRAARMKDAGERSELEAGMAKLFASETGHFCVEESLRIHGGYGYSKEYEIERLYRDAPLLLIGEGTSEIQRMVIGRKLLQRYKA